MGEKVTNDRFDLFEQFVRSQGAVVRIADPSYAFEFFGVKTKSWEPKLLQVVPYDFLCMSAFIPEIKTVMTVPMDFIQTNRSSVCIAHELGHFLSGKIQHKERKDFASHLEYEEYLEATEYPATEFALSYVMPSHVFQYWASMLELYELCHLLAVHPWDAVYRLNQLIDRDCYTFFFERDKLIPELAFFKCVHGHRFPAASEIDIDPVLPTMLAFEFDERNRARRLPTNLDISLDWVDDLHRAGLLRHVFEAFHYDDPLIRIFHAGVNHPTFTGYRGECTRHFVRIYPFAREQQFKEIISSVVMLMIEDEDGSLYEHYSSYVAQAKLGDPLPPLFSPFQFLNSEVEDRVVPQWLNELRQTLGLQPKDYGEFENSRFVHTINLPDYWIQSKGRLSDHA